VFQIEYQIESNRRDACATIFLKELPPELIEHGDKKGKQPVTMESGKGMFAAMCETED